MKTLGFSLIATIVLMLLAAPAGATITYYSSQSAWAAATSSVFTIDFNDVVVPNPPGFVDYSITGLQLHDVTFSANPATDNGLRVGPAAGGCPGNAFGVGNYFLCGNTYQAKYFEAALPTDVVAVAMLLLPNASGSSVTLTFPDNSPQVLSNLSSTTPVFAGFVFDQPVSSLKIEATSNFTALDNFAYAQMEPTPEASTALLAAVGLVSLLLARRLRRSG